MSHQIRQRTCEDDHLVLTSTPTERRYSHSRDRAAASGKALVDQPIGRGRGRRRPGDRVHAGALAWRSALAEECTHPTESLRSILADKLSSRCAERIARGTGRRNKRTVGAEDERRGRHWAPHGFATSGLRRGRENAVPFATRNDGDLVLPWAVIGTLVEVVDISALRASYLTICYADHPPDGVGISRIVGIASAFDGIVVAIHGVVGVCRRGAGRRLSTKGLKRGRCAHPDRNRSPLRVCDIRITNVVASEADGGRSSPRVRRRARSTCGRRVTARARNGGTCRDCERRQSNQDESPHRRESTGPRAGCIELTLRLEEESRASCGSSYVHARVRTQRWLRLRIVRPLACCTSEAAANGRHRMCAWA